MPGSSVCPPSAAFSSFMFFLLFPADPPGDIIDKAVVVYDPVSKKMIPVFIINHAILVAHFRRFSLNAANEPERRIAST